MVQFLKKHNREAYLQCEISIDDIQSSESLFECSGFIEIFWNDETIKTLEDISATDAPLNWEDLSENAVDEVLLEDVKHKFEIGTDGSRIIHGIYHIQLFCSEFFDTALFPVDSQVCNLTLGATCDDFQWHKVRPAWIPTDCCFLENAKNQMIKTRNGVKIAGSFYAAQAYVFYDMKKNRIVLKFCAEAKREFWVGFLLFPLFLVLIANVLTYGIQPEDVGDRLGMGLMIFLIILAFQVTMGDYGADGDLSLLDIYVFVGIGISLLSLIEIAIAGYLAINEEDVRAGDSVYWAGYFAFIILLHIFIGIMTFCGCMKADWAKQIERELTEESRWFPKDEESSSFGGFVNQGEYFITKKAAIANERFKNVDS